MNTRNLPDLDLPIARARIFLSLATLISIYVDPNVPDMTPWIRLTGGPMRIDRFALTALSLHLAYSAAMHAAASYRPLGRQLQIASTALDILFAVIVAIFTEGRTSPSFVFFAFAIITTAGRERFRATITVTMCTAIVYMGLILASSHGAAQSVYLTRPIYLAITGYLISFLGDQRVDFETQVRVLETRSQRLAIARSLHDGFIQSLAAVKLRLATSMQWLSEGQFDRGIADLAALQSGVAREYDGVRSYVRSLAELEENPIAMPGHSDTWFEVDVRFRARGLVTEGILLILLEGLRNVVQHAAATSAALRANEESGIVRISLDDDGIGFPTGAAAPWSIASRVTEAGGRIEIQERADVGAHLELEVPAT
jgi:signal transduction histidine kinase